MTEYHDVSRNPEKTILVVRQARTHGGRHTKHQDRGRLELTTQGLLDLIDDEDTLRTIRGATASEYVTLVEAQAFGIKHQLNRYLTESQETWLCQYAFQGESSGGDRLDEEIVSVEVEIESPPGLGV